MIDFAQKLREVQSLLKEESIDGWLLFDYRFSNPLARHFLDIPPGRMTTRRFLYWIPQKGAPIKIVPSIEPYILDHLPGIKWEYTGWHEWEQRLHSIAKAPLKIAMEYSPFNALPNISKVDAGFVELVRRQGAEVVSSANILQHYTSVWNADQLKSHREAAKVLDIIAGKTWDFIRRSLLNQHPINELQIQKLMLKLMDEEDCFTSNPPDCAVNKHSADPHYNPTEESAYPIQKGDFILLDLWCKKKTPSAIYADITRVGVAGSRPTERQEEIFEVVKDAQKRAFHFVQQQIENKRALHGWEVDDACRQVIREAGYDRYFIHRTGHNLGEEVHGPGANLDDFETHDDRKLIAGTGFTIEPGIYLPEEFGVRLEYDVYLNPNGSVEINGGVQEKIHTLDIS